ncbi:beta-hexosaminidase subunit A1 [Thecamonas trahens ATCC 50062]|uniref:Beta-hexosaminidase n=1 Tax=Thecamonas trahens ATCC 50062 TaxID=461836 RepID=A0A0L0DT36_THETB|nr:beta-hexosaminidase subunit A1 [Thecamonas trahens ATCC 50062]KNC55514.1 beta-hexosaminidase subunit A1 [Thecamonas trahens ATCC 50062]|eukprot:XP_013761292.1 beta-hexosaminidase subunit A1 [Thecamonas trahens ATCC 50062]
MTPMSTTGLVVVVLAATVALLAPPSMASVTTLWPQPQNVRSGTDSGVTLAKESFKMVAAPGCVSSALLSGAMERYMDIVFDFGAGGAAAVGAEAPGSDFSTLSVLEVCVASSDESLGLETDETYKLEIDGSATASLQAESVYGAMRGLETFAQLVEYGYTNDSYAIAATPITIGDSPAYPWRGLLVDTARHYMPADFLLHVLDAMAANKLNVLHWHIVDAQSFGFVVAEYPELSKYGAWHPTAIFTQAEIAAVVAHGKSLGIRVVPEFDGPGHAAAWGAAPDLFDVVAHCPAYEHNINNIPLNPASNVTFDVLAAVYQAAAKVFTDDFLHIGGDEVVQGCWTDDPTIAAWMREHNLNTIQVYQLFENAMHAIARTPAVNKSVVVWEEVFDNALHIPMNTIVEVWKSASVLKDVLGAGYRGLLAAPFYLDKQIPGLGQGENVPTTSYEWVDTWKSFYGVDMTANLTSAEAKLLLGGEGAMWAEQVMDTNFDSRVWPRNSAVAERLWSSPLVNDPVAATPRLNAQSCRMQRRGIMCGPVAPSFCLLPSDVNRHPLSA